MNSIDELYLLIYYISKLLQFTNPPEESGENGVELGEHNNNGLNCMGK